MPVAKAAVVVGGFFAESEHHLRTVRELASREHLRRQPLDEPVGVGLYALAPEVVALFASAMLLGIVRSGLLYGAKIGRALAIEAMLFVLATSVAQLLAGSTVQSYGLAVWGFFLVESAFFLFEGARPRAGSGSAEDPFERARREATRLMEEQPG